MKVAIILWKIVFLKNETNAGHINQHLDIYR